MNRCVAETATLSELLDGCSPSRELVGILERLGVVARLPDERYGCADRARLRLALLGLRIGLSWGELGALLELYDARGGDGRDVSHFVELLARYQRFVSAPSPQRRRRRRSRISMSWAAPVFG